MGRAHVSRTHDGEHFDYAEIAEAMRDLSRSSESDHHELLDHVVASVALGNTADHLRNHGFLADRASDEHGDRHREESVNTGSLVEDLVAV